MQGARRLKKSEQLGPDARYELLLRLASGGMGAVFVGVPRADTRPEPTLFAIKRAHAHLIEQPEFRKMFVAEASLARRIAHPNAVGVVDVDESEGELMMIMRYVEGGSLSDMLVASHGRGRRIAPPVTLRVVADAARGLEAAHALRDERGRPLGLVHRDVSPHNILVGLDGVSAIVDFGVAKAASIETTRTATDVMKGKTAYMAPEYVKSRVANAQTDVFSLGIVAWEALANRRLWKGEDEMDTIRRLLEPTPAPLLHQIVDLDPTVAAVVARAVSKDPAKRFPTAQAFGDALEQAARSADLLASPAEVASTVKSLLATMLAERRTLLAEALAVRAGAPPGRGAAGIADGMTQVAPAPIGVARPVATLPAASPVRVDAPPPAGLPASTALMPHAGAPTSVLPGGYPRAGLPPPLAATPTPDARPQLAHFGAEPAPTTAMLPDDTTTTAATPTARMAAPRRRRSVAFGAAAAVTVVAVAATALLAPRPSEQPAAAPGVDAAGEDATRREDDVATSRDAEPTAAPGQDADARGPEDRAPAPAAPAEPSVAPSDEPAGAGSADAEAPAAPSTSPRPAAAPPRVAPPRPPGGSSWRPKANPY